MTCEDLGPAFSPRVILAGRPRNQQQGHFNAKPPTEQVADVTKGVYEWTPHKTVLVSHERKDCEEGFSYSQLVALAVLRTLYFDQPLKERVKKSIPYLKG